MSRSTSILAAVATTAILAAGCSAGSSARPNASAGPSVETVSINDALDSIGQAPGEFSCAEPVPRQDDYMWICTGSADGGTATIHLYAAQVDGSVFGATLYTSTPNSQADGAAADATEQLAADVIDAAVPDSWREATRSWVSDHMNDGGRTLNVPGAGITAAVQPLTGLQWYLEFYELDGLEH